MWWNRLRHVVHEILTENISPRPVIHRLRTVVYFFVLVWRGFVVNRCPIRAAALSYTTLLALVPLLAVGVSVSKNFLHESSSEFVPRLMDKLFESVALTPDDEARQEATEKIQTFIDNINTGTLGTVGTVLLVFVTLQLLATIEQTFNDIWGIEQGRSFWKRIVYYWATVTLGPVLLFVAVYWTGRREFSQLLPYAVLWLAFSLMYALMPNTQVRPAAAIAGGLFAGTLWQVNSWLSTLYVSRAVSFHQIYGTLGVLPVLLVGLYFSWMIVLLGAQVAYAAQNVRAYLQQRAGERIDQRGKELLACRAVYAACECFLQNRPPPTVEDIAERTGAPPQWLNQLIHRLHEQKILTRSGDDASGVVPARPPESITLADVVQAVRVVPGAVVLPRATGGIAGLEKLLDELHAAERSTTGNQTFARLVSTN